MTTGPIDLRNQTLGRMLAQPCKFTILREIAKIPIENISADDFVTRMFAIVARGVPDEASATCEAYDAGSRIDASSFALLSKYSLDALAGAYLAQAARSIVSKPPNGDLVTEVLPGERQTERLLRLVKVGTQDLRAVAQQLTQRIPASLKESFARTSVLARSLDDSLTRMRNPGVRASTSANLKGLFEFELPPDPFLQINTYLANLLDIARQQAELSASLTQTSELALKQAIISGEDAKAATREARNGVRLGVAAIVVTLGIGIAGIYDNHRFTISADSHSDRLTDTIRLLSELQRQNATELGALRGTSASLAKYTGAIVRAQDHDVASNDDEVRALRDLTHQIKHVIRDQSISKLTPPPASSTTKQ
jgi:hypothetical protein